MATPSPTARFRLIKLCIQATNNLRDAVTRPRRLTSPRKKFALVIGISYKENENWRLNGPQTDVRSVKDLLINTLHFSEDEIVVISDADGTHEDFLPTHKNIMREVGKFVRIEQNVDYFFVYSGHSFQRKEEVEPGKRPVEKDGKEEYIIPVDALQDEPDFEKAVVQKQIISDKTLNKFLVKSLGKGSQLVALFDSCHSGTLLNLRHIRCNRVGDLRSLVQESARRVFINRWHALSTKQVAPSVSRSSGESSGEGPQSLRKQGTQLSKVSRDSPREHRWTMECLGFCPSTPSAGKAQVICFSACGDGQATIETNGGGMMITAIVQLLERNQSPSYRDVILAAREGTVKVKENIRQELDISSTKKSWRKFIPFYKSCATQREEDLQELARLKFDPQLSTLRSLNTKGLLRICDRASATTPQLPVKLTRPQVKFDPLPTRGISSQEFNRRQSLAGRPA